MSTPNAITVDGVEYRRHDSGPLSLIILHRGFIFVGRAEWCDDDLAVTRAQNVRKWTKPVGIGGLSHGAQSSGAVLDDHTDLRVPAASVLYVAELPEGWHEA